MRFALAALALIVATATAPAAEVIDVGEGDAALNAVLYRPQGPGPFPVIVGLHGCAGLLTPNGQIVRRFADWGERLSRQGLAVLFVDWRNLVVRSPAASGAWLQAVLLLVFAFGGFEGALIPMSEAKDPRRDAPFALFVALGATTLVYTLAQVVVSGVLAAPAQSDRPLAVAARQFLGPPGAVAIAAGALVSVYGLLSSMALYTPRLTFALAERGDFPPIFAAIHSRYRTPHFSILIYSLLVWALAASGSFRWNVTLSAAARLFTYAATCAALVRLRGQKPAEVTLRLPAGGLLALLGIAFSFTLVSRMGRGDLAIIAVTIVIALVNWLWARSGVRGQGPGVGGKEEG